MEQLTDRSIQTYSYNSRYNTIPYYYNKVDNKYVRGLSKHLSQSANYSLHIVESTDTLDSIALKYYGRPDLYWIIADFNHIRDPFINLYDKYNFVAVPAYSSVEFK